MKRLHFKNGAAAVADYQKALDYPQEDGRTRAKILLMVGAAQSGGKLRITN